MPSRFAKPSTSAVRAQSVLLGEIAALLGIDREALEPWLELAHGRTKLPTALGRLWPASPDEPRARLPMPEALGQARVSDARQSPELQRQLAQILGAPLSVVEADLLEEHHRSRLDNCGFPACGSAALDTRVKLLELIRGARASVFWAGYRAMARTDRERDAARGWPLIFTAPHR